MRAPLLILAVLLGGCGFFHHGHGDPADGPPLQGEWVLRSATLGDSRYTPADDEVNVLTLGRASVRVASCNRCSGTYREDPAGQTLAFQYACTEMACTERIDLGPMLDRTALRYRVGPDALVLRQDTDAGANVFTFARSR